MSKISIEMIKMSYELGKCFCAQQISLKEAKQKLVDIGMNPNSSVDYIYIYGHLIKGEVFTRTHNVEATRYYLEKFYEELGETGLRKALCALDQHFDYYEQKSGSSIKDQRAVYNEYKAKLANYDITFPEEVDKNVAYPEGKVKTITVNAYERNSAARDECILNYGCKCFVCGFDFEAKYGEIGKGYIHVHHKVDISKIGKEYSVDPKKDLIPVCPNCHAMLHTMKPAMNYLELKDFIKDTRIVI